MNGPAYDSLLGELTNWDCCLDSNGDIAVCTAPYALAQDVASACKTFLGECWFDMTVGVPYQTQIMGQKPPLTLLQQYLVQAALTVSGVISAQCVISAYNANTGEVDGQVLFIDSTGVQQGVSL